MNIVNFLSVLPSWFWIVLAVGIAAAILLWIVLEK